jgi:protein-S-isoprenylcysteine O-methyltransferase Ste14
MIRTVILASFAALLLVGGYHRWRAESGEPLNRRAEGWGMLIGSRLTAAAAFLVMARWFWNPASLAFADVPVPVALQWLGVAIVVVSVAWLMWMFRTLGKNITDTVVTRRDAQFVRRGPYRYVRNPMYVGVLMLLMGIAVALGNWMPAIVGVTIFTLLAIRTLTEERFLLAKFPEEYGRYMREVGRFWPTLRWR